MNNRILISLLFTACTLSISPVFANSPAMMDEPVNLDVEPEFIEPQNEARPAEEEATANEPVATTETITTGTVLTTTTKPILARQLDFPRRGMSEDKVKNELGSPNTVTPAVGKPPISQWEYDDRIVYFEYATVLHVVAK